MNANADRMTFEPVQRESTRQKVHGAIRRAILDGRLKTGQRLTEIPLAKEFQVSRAVIREALQQLAHDGLVEQSAYKGSQVVHLSPEQVDEIIAARMLIEPELARLARRRVTEADKRYLIELSKRLNAASDDPDLYTELDLAFHEKIWELSGNETLRKILLQITAPLFAMGSIMRTRLLRAGTGRSQFKRGGHSAVVEKICEGSPEEVTNTLREHIGENWKLTRQHLEEYLGQASSINGSTEVKKRPRKSKPRSKSKLAR
jgi:DNA-binding GntR family transcriptional regulator